MLFKSANYWSIKADDLTLPGSKEEFMAKCTHVKGQRIAVGKDFDDKTGKLKSDKGVIVLDKKKPLD